MTLGQKIKKLRNDIGLTQKELADKVFVTFQTVSKWEKDENEPDIATLRELAKLFGCSLDYLLSEEDNAKPVVEEEKPVVVVPPVEPVNKTIIIHQKELHVCEKCKKDIPEDELVMEDICIRHRGRGHAAEYRKGYYHKHCLEELHKEKEAAALANLIAHEKNAKHRCFGWGIFAGIAILVISLVALLINGKLDPVVSVFTSIGLGYAGFALIYCILSGSYIGEVFVRIASWSVKFPGVIFSFDLEGLVFLIAVKLLFVVLGALLSVFVLLLAVVISATLSIVSFPFILIHNIHNRYADAF